MTYRLSPKAGFVTMTSVAALMALGLSGTSAQAACLKVAKYVTCLMGSPAYIDAAPGITVDVETGAQVDAGGGSAVGLTGGGGTVINRGTINGAPGFNGVFIDNGGTITNLSNRVITGGTGAAILAQNGKIVIDNTGTISNVARAAIIIESASHNSEIINHMGGKITAGTFGILLGDVDGSEIINERGAAIVAATGIKVGAGMGKLTTITNKGNWEGTSLAIDAGGGNETITNDGSIKGTLRLGDGDNKVTNNRTGMTGGVISGDIIGGSGIDSVFNNDGTVSGKLELGAGANVVDNLRAGTIVGFIKTLGGNDIVRNEGVIGTAIGLPIAIDLGDGDNLLTNSATGGIVADVLMGAGSDRVTNDGAIGGFVVLGDGNNTLTNNGKLDPMTGIQKGILRNVTAGVGDDTVINSGFMGGNISLGAGNDTITLNMGMSVGGTIDGGAGNDSLILSSAGIGGSRVFNNQVSGVENLVVDTTSSTDTWVLDADYTFGSGSLIKFGGLEIRGGRTLESATVTLNGLVGTNSALLSGEGTIKGNLVVTKGVVTAGNGLTGTLSVTGDYANSADGVLEVAVGPGLAQTQLAVGGNVTLDGTLRVSVAAGFYKNGASYDVITFGGTRTGQFASAPLPAGTRFTKFKVNYTVPRVVQVLVEKISYATIGNSYNQRQAGDGLFRGGAGSAAGSDMEVVAEAFERLGTDEAMREALDSLSGEAWAGIGEVRGSVTRNFRELGMGRIGGNLEGVGVWGNVLQGQEDVKSDGNGERIKGEVGGLVGGVEYGFGGGKVGIMVGYGQGDLKLRSRGEGEVKLMMGGVYGGWNLGGFEVSGGVSYASGKQKVARAIVGSWLPAQRNMKGSEGVREFGMDVGVGYGINLGMIRVTPEVGLKMARVEEKGFEEEGGNSVSLSGEREKGWEGRGHVRVEVSAVFHAGVVSFEPYVKGGYERVLVGKGYQDREVSFQQPGTEFNVRSTDGSKNMYMGGGGLNVGFGPVTVGVGYQQSIGGKRDERTFKGSLGIRW